MSNGTLSFEKQPAAMKCENRYKFIMIIHSCCTITKDLKHLKHFKTNKWKCFFYSWKVNSKIYHYILKGKHRASFWKWWNQIMENKAFIVIISMVFVQHETHESMHCWLQYEESCCLSSVLGWWFLNIGQRSDQTVLKLTCLKAHKWTWKTILNSLSHPSSAVATT